MSDEDLDIFDELDRRMRAIMDEAFGGQATLFDVPTRSLRPLFKIEVSEDQVAVTIDLPYVEKKDIELSSTEDSLAIRAKMRKAVTLKVGGAFQKPVEFEFYRKKIRLPVRVDPTRARASFFGGILKITYPVVPQGSSVPIG